MVNIDGFFVDEFGFLVVESSKQTQWTFQNLTKDTKTTENLKIYRKSDQHKLI